MFKNLLAVKMCRNKFIIENGSHETNVIMVVLTGRFRVSFGSDVTVINSGEVVFFRKNQPFSRRILEPIEILYFTFDIENEKFFPQKNCRIHIPSGRIQQNIKLLQENFELVEYVATDIIISNYGFHISKGETVANEIIGFIKSNICNEIDLSCLAQKFNLSPSGMIYVVRKATGKTPKEIVISCRMERAEELLLGTDKQIKEIATLCGYQNEYYFSSAFKNHKGLSPTKYRRKYNI